MQLISNIWNIGIFGKIAILVLLLCTCGFCTSSFFRSDKEQATPQIIQNITGDIQSSPKISDADITQNTSTISDDLLDLSVQQEDIISYGTAARNLVLSFYILLAILLLLLLFTAIRTFLRRPTWGQARYMGIPFYLFVWLQVIFYLVMFEGAYDIVGLILWTPLWLDCLISVIIFMVPLIIFLRLRLRTTFKPNLFVPLVLLPLGIPAFHFVADLAQVGAIKFVRLGAITIIKNSDEFEEQIVKRTVGGTVKFVNTHQIGRLGDALTAKRLTALGYRKLDAKYTQIHGIDGIYILYDNDKKVIELLLVENKVDTGKLQPGTMTDQWIIERAQKMLESNNQGVAETGRLILGLLEKNPSVMKRQLWHHNLETGATTVTGIDATGVVVSEASTIWKDNFIKNQIQRWCQLRSLTCLPVQ